MLSKEFAGGILIMTGANSAVGLRSTPARYIFLDEVDAYPASADEEGDPVTLAEARSLTFAHRRKVFLVSTPTIRGLSRIEREFEASDQRRFFVPCPHCGAMQWLKFERLRWQKGQPETAEYHCEGCERPSPSTTRRRCWRRANGGRPRRPPIRHRRLSPLGALFADRLAELGADRAGMGRGPRVGRGDQGVPQHDPGRDMGRNRRSAGLAAAGGPARDLERGTVPSGGLFLTAGADVQKDRIEVDVWAWGRGLESWLVDHIVIEGGPGDPACWQQLTDLLGQTWEHASGSAMTMARLAIDTGYETAAVYAWARRSASRRWPRSKASRASTGRAR